MNKYDVLIVGGGTAGCACAYIAGKLGLKVLLVEKNSYLGGSITSSLVVPAMKSSNNSINTDFFDTLYSELRVYNSALTYSDGNKGWINPELTKIILDKLMNQANVTVIFESSINSIKKDLSSYIVTLDTNKNLRSNNNVLLPYIETINIVDATGDAKICEMLNCEFLDKNDENKTQPINLRFIMSGINPERFVEWIMLYDKNREVTTSCTADGQLMFSTAYTWDNNTDWALRPIFREGISQGIITEEDSNYFQIFSIAGASGSVAFNCPRILEKNIDRTNAYIKARESILRLAEFCKRYFPGFEKAYISQIANSLGVRVSNRVKGKYVYTKDDLVNGKRFSHPVLISNYPIDVHSSDKNNSKLEKVYQEYQLPIESLIVDDNLFVIGRCISAEFEAQGALRIIPSCCSMGEGLAKYIHSKLMAKTESQQ